MIALYRHNGYEILTVARNLRLRNRILHLWPSTCGSRTVRAGQSAEGQKPPCRAESVSLGDFLAHFPTCMSLLPARTRTQC